MSTQIIKSLKLDAQKPFSIILKHVILSGINGFKTGTNGNFIFLYLTRPPIHLNYAFEFFIKRDLIKKKYFKLFRFLRKNF